MRPLKGGLSVGCGPHGGFLCQYIDNELSAKLKKARARTPQIAFQRHSKTTFNGFKSVPLGVKVYLWGGSKVYLWGARGARGARGLGGLGHAWETRPRNLSLQTSLSPSGSAALGVRTADPRWVRSQLPSTVSSHP